MDDIRKKLIEMTDSSLQEVPMIIKPILFLKYSGLFIEEDAKIGSVELYKDKEAKGLSTPFLKFNSLGALLEYDGRHRAFAHLKKGSPDFKVRIILE